MTHEWEQTHREMLNSVTPPNPPVDVERAGFDTLERDRKAQITLAAINASARANYLLEQNASDLLCLAYEYRDRLEHSCRKTVGSCRRCHVEQVLARAMGVS